MKTSDLINLIVINFEQKADENRAISASNYMKGKFTFYGVDATTRKAIQKEWFTLLKQNEKSINRWEIVRELWEKECRELHYVAIDWMNSWKKETLQKEDIEQFEWLITNHSWWDSVDSIASNVLGTYFKQFPDQVENVIREWRNNSNMWLNRSCLIYQLKYKKDVDFQLLKSLIQQYQPVKEFFIQKAIGWSLRQYSKFNPDGVRDFIEEINLQGLARREGAKYLSN
jgi:3-methyladenine DNA glycosylase AlkD